MTTTQRVLRRRTVVPVLAGMAAIVLVTSCSSSSKSSTSPDSKTAAAGGQTATSGKPFNILYIAGLTGVATTASVGVQRGAQAAVDYFNAHGGVLGRKLVLTSKDDQSDPTKGVTILQSALTSGTKPDFVIPGISSNEGTAMAPQLTRYKAIGIGSASAEALDNPSKYPNFFNQGPLQRDVLAATATFISSHPNVKRAALIVSDDALGQAEEATFKSAMTAHGITPDVELYPPSGTDFTPVFQKAVANKPDWIYMDGAGSEVGILLTSRVKANAGSIPTIVGSDAASQPLLTLAKGTNELDNTFAALLPTQAYIAPASRGPYFSALLTAISSKPLVSSLYVYSVGWDIINLYVEGLKNVKGAVTVDSLRTSLEHLPASTDPQFPLYKHTFTPQSHSPVASASDLTFGQEESTSDGFIHIK